jgi:TolB-like protein/Flp pilus assembly protein TadD
MAEQARSFLPFRLDLANEQLWREEQLITLRPKTFAILRYLAENPQRLVTKDELLHAIWGETLVSEDGLRDYLREIRQALGDDAEAPRFVQTVRGRGYRFLPAITTQPVESHKSKVTSQNSEPTPNPQSLIPSATLSLPDKPSIIVLPFINLSNDPNQEYFSDGITEDITNSLSRLSSLFVISRTSAFTYKGKPTKVQEISKEMGVRYVLEGSIRRADDQIRVTAQLINAITDHHLWAEHYDRPLTDIFAVQDEIVQRIVTTLKLQLTLREQGYIVRKRTDNPEAYDYYLRGFQYLFRFTKKANDQARQMCEKALALDSRYADASILLGWTYFLQWFYWSQNPHLLEQAYACGQKAKALDDALPTAYHLLGFIALFQKQHDQAIAALEQSLSLAPNMAEAYAHLGLTLTYAGRPEEAIELVETAIRRNPRAIDFLAFLAFALHFVGRDEEAIAVLQRALVRNPDYIDPHALLAIIYSELGRLVEARTEVAETLRLKPENSLEAWRQKLPFKDPAVLERHIAAARKAGLR